MPLDAVCTLLGAHYADWKFAEKEKNKFKDMFFAYATERSGASEEVLVTVYGRGISEADAIERAEKYNPRFGVDVIRPSKDGWEAIMVTRPEYTSFLYVNGDANVSPRMVYQRQVVDGPPLLDDERMAADDPDLYAEITFELPWGERVVRPLHSLDASTLMRVQGYIYKGKPTVKLPAPRPATEEELDSGA